MEPVAADRFADGPWRGALAYDPPKTIVNAGRIVEGDRRRIWRPCRAIASDFELFKTRLPVRALQTPLNQGSVDRRRGWARASELLSKRASEQMGWLQIARDHPGTDWR
jgi:hypothetical protein